MRHLICWFFVFLNPLIFHGQQLSFNHLTTENGLQNGNVRAITEDYQGFIWIATEDGLHRFDGYDIKVYRHTEGDSTSISSNFILTLYEDGFHNLWAGTIDEGLCLYNRELDNFITFKHKQNDSTSIAGNAIRSVFQASDQYIYVGSSGFSRITFTENNSISIQNIKLPSWIDINPLTRVHSLIEIRDGVLWMCVNNFGVIEYDIKRNEFTSTILSKLEQNYQSLFIDKTRDLVWAGTWKNGLVIVDPKTNDYYWHKANGSSDELQSNLQISQIKGDKEGNIWIGTDNGLSYFDSKNDPFREGGFITYLPKKDNNTTINGSSIKAIHIDRRGRLWAGAYYEGINVYDKHVMDFGFMDFNKKNETNDLYSNVSSIIRENSDVIWIGCDGRGLFKIKNGVSGNDQREFDHVTLKLNSLDQPISKIKCMALDEMGTLWIGTWGNGLIAYDTKSNLCKSISEFLPDFAIGTEILSLVYKDEVLWIGTFDNGLFRYDLRKNQIEKYNSTSEDQKNKVDRIYSILIDKNQNIWIGKEAAGLNLCNSESQTYGPVNNDILESTSTITALFEDENGDLWIGLMNKGLVKYNLNTKNCDVFSEKQGLANNVIHSILEDEMGRLWLSTNLGISVFDRQKEKFTNFNKANGLIGNQFNHASQAKLSDGIMIFGNTRGINYFNPNSYSGEFDFPNIIFTEFLLNNIEQLPGLSNSVLKKNITITNQIDLNYYNNSFSVTYAALDFSFSNQIDFAYMLKGFDKEWQYVGTKRQASYTNLDPGNYTLKLKASNLKKEWPENSFDLSINIMPAWWQTRFFQISLMIGIILLGFAFHRIRINYLVKQKGKLTQQVQEKTKDLNETNQVLRDKIYEINKINALILDQKKEISQQNNEIQAQNEELISQNEQINDQRAQLVLAQKKLKTINNTLEKLVDEKTEALQSTINQLNKTVFELDRFVYSASHDLMAPLKSIRGLVQLSELEKDHNRISEYLQLINSSIFKLEDVIKSLVEYSRNAHQELDYKDIVLHDLINEVYQELAFLPNASKVKLNNKVPEHLIVNNDLTRLKIILHNMINNGIKYADFDKKSELNIEISEKPKNWILTFSDNGIGIEKNYLNKIFNMYFRATDKASGSGLGLFIVQEILDKLGGSIQVNSEYGESTTFTIILPKN